VQVTIILQNVFVEAPEIMYVPVMFFLELGVKKPI